jgi:thioredoxin 2
VQQAQRDAAAGRRRELGELRAKSPCAAASLGLICQARRRGYLFGMADVDVVEYPCARCGAANRIPRARLGDDPKCGRCKQSVFPDQPVAVTDATWKREVEDCPIPVLVDFWAPWCGPCRAVAPVLEHEARERKSKLKIAKLNVDENPRTAGLHRVQSIPTLMLQRGPLFLDRLAGALPKAELDAWIDRYV